jgi:hypothetical protein
MSGPVTPADGVRVVRNADGLDVCTGCGAPVVKLWRSQIRSIHHVAPCAEAERVSREEN